MKQRYYLLAFLFLLVFFGIEKTSAADVTISTANSFSSLDGSASDADGTVNGVFKVNGNLSITGSGSITSPGGVFGINLNITGDLVMDIGATINGDVNTGGSAAGVHITIVSGGTIILHGDGSNGAAITSNQTAVSCAGGKAGNISLTAAGDLTIENGAVVSANAECTAGQISVIATNGQVSIAGLVQSKSNLNGTGVNQSPGGGAITVKGKCTLTVDNTGKVSSEGGAPGADLVHLEACTVNVYGLVQSTGIGFAVPTTTLNHLSNTNRPDKPVKSTAGVEIWADNITIDKTSPRNGEVNADLSVGTTSQSWIDIIARKNINIIGRTSGNFAIHANNGGANPVAGTVSIKSLEGSIIANGRSVQAKATTSGAEGGIIDVQSKLDINLNNAKFEAIGSNVGPTPNGGSISIKAFGTESSGSAKIIANAVTNFNVTGGSGNGVVNLIACGTIGFPDGTITPGTITPVKVFDACGGDPSLQAYVILPVASCISLPCVVVPPSCPAPANITAGNITSSTANIAWDSVPGVYKFILRRKIQGDNVWVYSSVIAPEHKRQFTQLLAGTTYNFEIQTYCTNSASDTSNFVPGPSFTTLSYCPAPLSLATSNITSQAAVANWNGNGNSTGFRVRIRKANTNTPFTVYIIKHSNVSSFQFTGLAAGTSYEWSVRSICSAQTDLSGFTDPSQVFSTLTCDAPSGITVSDVKSSSAIINWNPIPGVYKYQLRRRIVGDTKWVYSSELAPVTQRKFVDMQASTHYEFEIQTFCNSSLEDSSGFVLGGDFTTLSLCVAPVGLATIDVAPTSAIAHWDDAANSNAYRLRIRKANTQDLWTVYLIKNSIITSFQFTGLTPSTTYEWSVRNVCSVEVGDISNFADPAATFTTPSVRLAGNSEANESNVISLYPSPNNGSMTVALNTGCACSNTATIEITNLFGQVISSYSVEADNGNIRKDLTISDNAVNGVYILRVTQGDKSFISRFMLER